MDRFNRAAQEGLQFVADELKKIQKQHYDSTTPMDSYFTGMWNGMEVLIATLEKREGQFKTVEQLEFTFVQKQQEIETLEGK